MITKTVNLNYIAVLKDGVRFLCRLTPYKLWNYFRINVSFFHSALTHKVKHQGEPISLTIETTAVCNLSCPECPAGQASLQRPLGVVTRELFYDIINQTHKGLANLSLYFQGEPFLHPKLYELVAYANRHGIYTSCSTNGTILTETFGRKVIEAGLDRLIISVDGTDKETYEKYRKGGNYEMLVNGIRCFNSMKREMKVSNPLIVLQFIIFRFNEDQIAGMKSFARSVNADVVEFKSARFNHFGNGHPWMPVNEKWSRYRKNKTGKYELIKPLKNSCFRMWSSTVITWDGTVVPCCFDKDALFPMGSVKEKKFKEIWRSKEYNDFRKQILQDRKTIHICTNCTS